ncbi:hypothetical protein OUZ56_030683 [Daphnia magna]|uniref:Uncharacterized protein n=1 Tax=Daphnia magna TaxID=35525 RepID=A0ABQ9ZS07_9CRUS|nr:hypothetical protein OUZ56_030683 [Daphnia magna]
MFLAPWKSKLSRRRLSWKFVIQWKVVACVRSAVALLSDLMSCRGKIFEITENGLNKMKKSVLMLVSN